MNPYTIAVEIRKTYNSLNDFAYKSFDSLEPEMRGKLNIMLESLNVLARKIEKDLDEEFTNLPE